MGNAPYVKLLPDRPNLKNRVDPDAKIRMSLGNPAIITIPESR